MSARYLIVNADDFGASEGVNRGIIECHTRGIVTSTSLMVTGRAVDEAVDLSRAHPELAIGLHWDVWGEDEREFDTEDLDAVRAEFARQLEAFHDLMGRGPTHVDSHRHAHREDHVMPVFRELVEPLGVPLRGDGTVNFVGGFYAQWEWGVTELEHVSVDAMRGILANEVGEGWTEIACHPARVTGDFRSSYLQERADELATLTEPGLLEEIEAMGVTLASYHDLARVSAGR